MAIIKPFSALRPKNEIAHQVASLPYDVMNSAEAKDMAKDNPLSFLHVSRAEIDLDDKTDIHSELVYAKAKDNFLKMIKDGILVKEQQDCYYIYAQTMDGRTQYGLVACSSIDDYFNDVIKKHEYTRPEKEKDRIEHMKAVEAHVGPIFLTYPTNSTIRDLIRSYVSTQKSLYNFISEDGIKHESWVINQSSDINLITETFNKEIPFTYIADGHHRTASAAKVGMELREKHMSSTAHYNFFLSVLFDSNELVIMDYNRIVKDLNGYSESEFLNLVAQDFDIEKINTEDAKPKLSGTFGMYLNKEWYQLRAKKHIIKTDPIGVLDVSILQENILSPILGIVDPRVDKRIDFVGGIRGMKALSDRVDSGEMAVAFSLFPVSLNQLINIADSGNVMPPKSTWFEPKLRDGLFSHLFELTEKNL